MKCIIVDDEINARNGLRILIQKHCPELQLMATADSAKAAVELIEETAPELVFLDVEMPLRSGFDILELFAERPFQVIFVTAHQQYALRALRASAIDYLLKPVETEELRNAVSKALAGRRASGENSGQQLESVRSLARNLSGDSIRTIILNHTKGFTVVDTAEIVRLEADSNYTAVHLSAGRKMLVTHTLKEFEEILDRDIFFRTHKSHVINLKFMEGYLNERGGMALMKDGSKVEISSRKLSDFMDCVGRLHKQFKR